MNFHHVLIFGGTGMLSQASGWVAEHANHTIAFGRNRNRLEQLKKTYRKHGLKAQELDYTDTIALKNMIKDAYIEYGKINLVIAWIHGTAPDAIPTIKKLISELQGHHPWTLVVVKGSSSHLASITASEADVPDNCIVKEVQLGFIYNGVTSRWLTHQEISEGVINAINSNESKTVVGTLDPWDKRP